MRISTLAIPLALLLSGAALADAPLTWNFDLQTTGQNVFWTSPTAVNPAADRFKITYEMTQLIVTVRYSIFPAFDIDVTDQVPPEQRSGSGIFDGPLPITFADQDVIYPDPPAPTSFSAHVQMTLDAAGLGHLALTNVYLGTLVVNVPPFGNVTVQLQRIHIIGVVHPQALWWGDLNCDGLVNAFDIDPFILALTDSAAYVIAFPGCEVTLADANHDGHVDPFDIDPFIALLTGK